MDEYSEEYYDIFDKGREAERTMLEGIIEQRLEKLKNYLSRKIIYYRELQEEPPHGEVNQVVHDNFCFGAINAIADMSWEMDRIMEGLLPHDVGVNNGPSKW